MIRNDCELLRDIYGIIVSAGGAGTCSTTGGMKHNDYFVLSTHMVHAPQHIHKLSRAKLSPHTPVQLVTRPLACHVYGLQIQQPEMIPRQRIIGPTQQPSVYETANRTLKEAKARLATGQLSKAHRLSDHAYSSWARNAETELCQLA